MNSPTQRVAKDRPPVGWSFADMIFAIVSAAAIVFLLGASFSLAVRVLGFTGVRAYLRTYPVIFSVAAGTAVYSILLAAIYLRIIRRRNVSWKAIGFRRPPLLLLLLTPVIGVGQILLGAFMNLLVLSITGEFENPQIASISGGQGFSWVNFGLMLLLVGGLAPIVEEVMFRGLIYNWLRSRMPVFLAVILSAAVFAVAHVIPLLFPALFVVGIILALAYELTDSLWISILLHAIQNSVAVTAIFTVLALDMPIAGWMPLAIR